MDKQISESAGEKPQQKMNRQAFVFYGKAGEYFGIWIVNILLTVLTLGIYSAWAKVRRKRYFYGCTWLAGSSFDYHARPISILIGRIIVLIFLIAYNLSIQFLPIVGGLLGLAFLFAIPWFVMRGLRFNARVTSYRNIRFDFTGGYWEAFLAFVLGGLLAYSTLGILAPIASQWMWNYTLGNLRYGNRPIACDPRLGKLFGRWLLPFLVAIIGLVVMVLLGVGLFFLILFFELDSANSFFGEENISPTQIVLLVYAGFIPFFIVFMIAGLIYQAGVRNVAFNETVIDSRHLLSSNLHRGRYTWIAVSNFLATIFTLGLARPWAAIRMTRYLAVCTALYTTGSLDDYLGDASVEGAAAGSEFMDFEGIDFGI